jgi:hypothetical protein
MTEYQKKAYERKARLTKTLAAAQAKHKEIVAAVEAEQAKANKAANELKRRANTTWKAEGKRIAALKKKAQQAQRALKEAETARATRYSKGLRAASAVGSKPSWAAVSRAEDRIADLKALAENATAIERAVVQAGGKFFALKLVNPAGSTYTGNRQSGFVYKMNEDLRIMGELQECANGFHTILKTGASLDKWRQYGNEVWWVEILGDPYNQEDALIGSNEKAVFRGIRFHTRAISSDAMAGVFHDAVYLQGLIDQATARLQKSLSGGK